MRRDLKSRTKTYYEVPHNLHNPKRFETLVSAKRFATQTQVFCIWEVEVIPGNWPKTADEYRIAANWECDWEGIWRRTEVEAEVCS